MLIVVAFGAGGSLAALAGSGCGSAAEQNASEPRATFPLQVTQASFPTRQSVAKAERLVLSVRNTGTRTVPNVTVAVNSFYYTSSYTRLAADKRPVWVVDDGPGALPSIPVETVQVDPPGGGATATYNVWALGRLAPGASRSFSWRVTPVKPGVHTVSYRVYADLNGKSRARLPGGGVPQGSFTVAIAGRPPQSHVDPQTGKVVSGPYAPGSS